MSKSNQPLLGITIGDPGGIGPEIVKKIGLKTKGFVPVLFGSKAVATENQWPQTVRWVDQLPQKIASDTVYAIDPYPLKKDYTKNKPCKENGKASLAYLKAAVKEIEKQRITALVTAPICKKSWQLAGMTYTGHTTCLKDLSASQEVSMAFYTEKLKVILATIHLPLSDVPKTLSQKIIKEKINHAHLFLNNLGMKKGKIAVAGLNPHASEDGLFGEEESSILTPAIYDMRQRGVEVSGPYPADTVFRQARLGQFDLVIAMYHDQGLIPIKLLDFDQAVNITLGLPFVRTSPDHGTAFDIAYQNKASTGSMEQAIKVALNMLENKGSTISFDNPSSNSSKQTL